MLGRLVNLKALIVLKIQALLKTCCTDNISTFFSFAVHSQSWQLSSDIKIPLCPSTSPTPIWLHHIKPWPLAMEALSSNPLDLRFPNSSLLRGRSSMNLCGCSFLSFIPPVKNMEGFCHQVNNRHIFSPTVEYSSNHYILFASNIDFPQQNKSKQNF